MQLGGQFITRLEIETEPPGPEHLPECHLDIHGRDPHGNPFEMGGYGVYLAIQHATANPELKQMVQDLLSLFSIRNAMDEDGIVLKRPGNNCRSRFNMRFSDTKEVVQISCHNIDFQRWV